jgi:hypothetical protein
MWEPVNGIPFEQSRRGIVVAALLMVAFGMAEVATGFTHNFFGVSTAMGTASAYIGAGIGHLPLIVTWEPPIPS